MLIEKGSQSVQKLVTLSPVLKHWDHTKLQKQIADVHHAFQVSHVPALDTEVQENREPGQNTSLSGPWTPNVLLCFSPSINTLIMK